MIWPVTQFQGEEPRESLDLAKVSLLTASQLLGDALKVIVDQDTRAQVQDILDQVDNSLDALRDLML